MQDNNGIILISRAPAGHARVFTKPDQTAPTGTTEVFPQYSVGSGEYSNKFSYGKFQFILYPTKVVEMTENDLYLNVLAIGHAIR